MSVCFNDVILDFPGSHIKVYRSLEFYSGDISYFVLAFDPVSNRILYKHSTDSKAEACELARSIFRDFPKDRRYDAT